MLLSEWLIQATDRLSQAGFISAKMEAQVLAGHAMLVDRAWVLSHPEHGVNDLALEALLQRRENGEPLAYILGYREFYSRRFRVDTNVLIPRHETEVLIETALQIENKLLRVLDIGTGSGCIAVTLKLERPDWSVWATDISFPALQVARENAETLGADVTFRHSNLFEQLEHETFDLIVSNPPYIGRDEPLGSIPGTVPRVGPGFEGCAFRERCDFADDTCVRAIPRHAAGPTHEFLCRLPA